RLRSLVFGVRRPVPARRQRADGGRDAGGGSAALWLVLLCGIGIVAIQFAIVAGLLPAVG
ncbi:hypothetical protein V7P28_34555, partial [Klebsiella michiganensis]